MHQAALLSDINRAHEELTETELLNLEHVQKPAFVREPTGFRAKTAKDDPPAQGFGRTSPKAMADGARGKRGILLIFRGVVSRFASLASRARLDSRTKRESRRAAETPVGAAGMGFLDML